MDIAGLRARYKDIIPFIEAEMKDDIMSSAFRQAVNYYNKFNPTVIPKLVSVIGSEHEFIAPDIPEAILRVYYYSIPFDTTSSNLNSNWNYSKPILIIDTGTYYIMASYNITLSNVDLDLHDRLDELVKIELIIALSNKRRMGTLTELPLDFKGDTFYQEAITDRDRIQNEIKEMVPTTY